jgi:hypothetical protein
MVALAVGAAVGVIVLVPVAVRVGVPLWVAVRLLVMVGLTLAVGVGVADGAGAAARMRMLSKVSESTGHWDDTPIWRLRPRLVMGRGPKENSKVPCKPESVPDMLPSERMVKSTSRTPTNWKGAVMRSIWPLSSRSMRELEESRPGRLM